jgi:hypothetical protein
MCSGAHHLHDLRQVRQARPVDTAAARLCERLASQ